jgi:hypothetical protein
MKTLPPEEEINDMLSSLQKEGPLSSHQCGMLFRLLSLLERERDFLVRSAPYPFLL